MEWNDKLATNIDLIDTQHKEIIRRLNDVLLAQEQKNNEKYLKLTLKLLHDYCATHFSQEENLQLRKEYPQYKQHKKLHTIFLKKIREFENSPITNELAINIEKVIGEWLVKHIDGVDKVLAKYILQKG